MSQAWLSLGANIGEPHAQLAEAVERIGAHPDIKVTRQSTMLVTAPWGKTDQPDFLNLALELDTSLAPLDLLEALLGIELEMGRTRKEIWGPRVIDIDLIAYDRMEMQTPRLTLPHPRAHERDFVLVPLREIAPDTADWLVGRSGT